MGRLVVDVSAILGDPGASLEVDDDVPLERLSVGDTLMEFAVPPRTVLTVSNTGLGIVVTGTVSAQAMVECARCLEPFTLVVEGVVESGFLPAGEIAEADPDEGWESFDGESIDLLPAIVAALVMEVPFAPVHDESCRGICPVCGCDLNREQCGCEPAEATEDANPFAVLKDLVTEGETDEE